MQRVVLALLVVVLWGGPAAAEPVRLRVAVVLDASASMKQNDPDLLARLAARLVADLADGRDQVSLVSFGTSARRLVAAKGSENKKFMAALDALRPDESCTDYARGLSAAAAEFQGPRPPGERRLVVFLTDGEYHPARAGEDRCKADTRFESPRLADADRKAFAERVTAAAADLSRRGAKVFVVGLGRGFDKAERSKALLAKVAQGTGGRLLVAGSADRVPELFTDIFAALVGSPVEKPPLAASVQLNVPPDTERLQLVVRTDSTELPVTLTNPDGAPFPFGSPGARGPEFRVEGGRKRRGYALWSVEKPGPGRYTLARTKAGEGLRVWALYDVGTALRIEKVPDALADGSKVTGAVALRSRHGKPIAWPASYVDRLSFSVTVDGKTRAMRPDKTGAVQFQFPPLPPRPAPYVVQATAKHDEGFLEVDPIKLEFRVVHRVALSVTSDPVAFDSMAEPGTLTTCKVRVTAPATLPVPVTLKLSASDERTRQDLRFEPPSVTFGPNAREAEIRVTFADPEALRWQDRRYAGELVFSADDATKPLLSEKTGFSTPVDGTLRSWTLGRWLEEHWGKLAVGLFVLWLVLLLVGRAVASKFPPKARIHYVELDSPFENDSLIKRYARHGAFRSARFQFPLGKKAKKLVTFTARGRGFEVRAEAGIVVARVSQADATGGRAEAGGVWDERYRLGDRYEVWLTRS
jgi:Mg-chelatase subunit ChlD